MSQLPIKPSSLTSVIREVLKVRTKGALAGVNLLMIAIVFPIILFFGTAMTLQQMGAIIALFLAWQAFAIYALRQLPSHDMSLENTNIVSKGKEVSLEQPIRKKRGEVE